MLMEGRKIAAALAFLLLAAGSAGRARAQARDAWDPLAATVEPDAGLDKSLGRQAYVATFFDAKGDVIGDPALAQRYCITDNASGATTAVKPVAEMTAEDCRRARLDNCLASLADRATTAGSAADPVLDGALPADFAGAARDAYSGAAAEMSAAKAFAEDASKLAIAPAVKSQAEVLGKPGARERNRALGALAQIGDELVRGVSRLFDGSAARQPLPGDARPQDPFFPSK